LTFLSSHLDIGLLNTDLFRNRGNSLSNLDIAILSRFYSTIWSGLDIGLFIRLDSALFI
jgi:hypothetical protein